jgi:hypothetical protein
MKIILIRLICLTAIILGGFGIYTFGYERLENLSGTPPIILSEAGYVGGAIASGLVVCMGLYCFLKFEMYLLSKESQ